MLTIEDYQKLEEAWRYQDFITKEMLKLGVSVNAFQSVDYQMEYGESASGIEIKNDRKMASTGNVYIEFRQTTIRGTENRDSGIHQKDDSWLYIIGDYDKFYIFAKSHLQRILGKVQRQPRAWWNEHHITIREHKDENGNVTSYGLVIPIKYIEEHNLAIKTVEVNK